MATSEERLMQSIAQITHRIDNHAEQIIRMESKQDSYDEKISDIKNEIQGFKRGIFWLNTTVWGAMIVVTVKWVIDGGLSSVAKAAGF